MTTFGSKNVGEGYFEGVYTHMPKISETTKDIGRNKVICARFVRAEDLRRGEGGEILGFLKSRDFLGISVTKIVRKSF